MACADPECRRRLGRGRHQLQARLSRLRAGTEHRLPDRLGAARPDGRRRDRSPGRGTRHSTTCWRTQAQDGLWMEKRYTATGFPRVFYLRYHGYPKFFPLMGAGALSLPDAREPTQGRIRDVTDGRSPCAEGARVPGRPRGGGLGAGDSLPICPSSRISSSSAALPSRPRSRWAMASSWSAPANAAG